MVTPSINWEQTMSGYNSALSTSLRVLDALRAYEGDTLADLRTLSKKNPTVAAVTQYGLLRHPFEEVRIGIFEIIAREQGDVGLEILTQAQLYDGEARREILGVLSDYEAFPQLSSDDPLFGTDKLGRCNEDAYELDEIAKTFQNWSSPNDGQACHWFVAIWLGRRLAVCVLEPSWMELPEKWKRVGAIKHHDEHRTRSTRKISR